MRSRRMEQAGRGAGAAAWLDAKVRCFPAVASPPAFAEVRGLPDIRVRRRLPSSFPSGLPGRTWSSALNAPSYWNAVVPLSVTFPLASWLTAYGFCLGPSSKLGWP